MSLPASKMNAQPAERIKDDISKVSNKSSKEHAAIAADGKHAAKASAVHGLHAGIERAYSTREDTEFTSERIPLAVTIAGAATFSAVCWAVVIALIF